MSFESDLLAWARRQINLPPLLGLPPDQQRKLLQRLLIGAILPRLEAIRPGSAEDPEIREAIRLIPEIVVSENEFVLERGLVIVQQSALSIHASTELALEWQGPAPPYTWLNIEHPQGELSMSAVTCPGLVLAPTWTGAESLGAQGEYQSRATSEQIQAWRIEGMRDSVLYTGLLRLLAEGWGPHESLGKLQPGTWPIWTTTEASYRGMIRVRDDVAQTYRWYLVYLGPTLGCRAVQLTPDASVTCLVDELYNGALTPAEWVITEAWVLRKLARDPATEELSLITKTEYDETVIGFTLAHGWKFAPQRRGTALENSPQANIVVLEYEEGTGNEAWYNTRLCKVSFLFTGILTANLSLAEQGKFYPDSGAVSHPLWIETGDGLTAMMMPRDGPLFPDAPSDLSANTPVYAVDYDSTEIDLLRYKKKEFVSEPGNPTYSGVRLFSCEGEVDTDQWYRDAALVVRGGWKTNKVDFTGDIVLGASERWTRRFWHEPHGEIQGTANRTASRGCGCSGSSITIGDWRDRFTVARQQSCDGDAVEAELAAMKAAAFDFGPFGPMEAQGSRGSLEKEEERFDADDYGGHAAIIPKLDASAIILITGQSIHEREIQSPGGARIITRPISDWGSECTTAQFPSSSRAEVGKWRFSLLVIVNDGDPLTCVESSWWPYQGDSCYCNDPNGGCVGGQSFETVESFANPSKAELKIIGQGITVDGTTDFDDIKDYIEATFDNPTRPWNPFVKMRFDGAAIYQEKPELSDTQGIISNAGFNPQALSDGVDFRFVSS